MKSRYNNKFRLEQRKDKKQGRIITSNVPIIFDFTFDGKRFLFYTGCRTNQDKWDETSQRVFKGTTKEEKAKSSEINERLAKIEINAGDIYKEAIALRIHPTVQYMKDELKKRLDDTQSSNKGFFEIFDHFIKTESIKNNWTLGTVKKMKSNYEHLQKFQTKKNYKIDFDNIDERFFNRYFDFLITELNHRNTTIYKNLKIIKWFLNWATKNRFNQNLAFREFKPEFKGVAAYNQIIYLSLDELLLINYCDIKAKYLEYLKEEKLNFDKNQVESKIRSLEQVRDVFCFCCYTGLRYSDVFNLKRSNIKSDHIELTTIKTEEKLYIDLNDPALEIIKKYAQQIFDGNKCLPVISNQKMNEHLKDLGKIVKLNEELTLVYFIGAQRNEKTYFKWQLLTTHVARRTFVTNAFYLDIPSDVIMTWTGHTTTEAMKPYHKIVDEQKKKEMTKFNKIKELLNRD